MSNFEGNPFFWGFSEQRGIETLAQRAKAIYNEPRETADRIPAYPHPTEDDENASLKTHFFDQEYGVSPNPAFVIGASPIEPMPYIAPKSSSSESDEEQCEDEEVITEDTENEETKQ